MHRSIQTKLVAVAAGALVASAAQGGAIIRTFDLFNHVDGQVNPQAYGLRLDGFPDGSGDNPATLSFETAGVSTMTLDVIDMGGGVLDLHVHGTAWGNSATGGTDYGTYNLDFTYAGVTDTGNGWEFTDVELVGTVSAGDATAAGFLASPLELWSKSNGDYSFGFLADGHRISGDNSTWVGRGWVDPTVEQDGWPMRTHDFLFIGREGVVPLPSAALLGAAGLGGLAIRRRR